MSKYIKVTVAMNYANTGAKKVQVFINVDKIQSVSESFKPGDTDTIISLNQDDYYAVSMPLDEVMQLIKEAS